MSITDDPTAPEFDAKVLLLNVLTELSDFAAKMQGYAATLREHGMGAFAAEVGGLAEDAQKIVDDDWRV